MFEIHVDSSSCPSVRVDLGTSIVCNKDERCRLLFALSYAHNSSRDRPTESPRYRPLVISDLAGRSEISIRERRFQEMFENTMSPEKDVLPSVLLRYFPR